METNNIRLTAPEIASLWTQYMFDTMSILFSQYALEHIDDKDIHALYVTALELSINHVQQIKDFLTQENYPIPQGFTEQDVNKKAPRLFQDPFYIYYLYVMTLQGMTGYSLSVSTSIRSDIRKYYIACNKETMMLFDKTIDAMLKKGLYSRPPVIDPPDSVDFIKHQSFLTGWLGERRPLTVLEIGDITFNMIKMNLHAALKVGFIQVAKSEEVRQLIMRGHKIANKHIETFESIFREENLNSPISWQSLVTNSTLTPFSDKYLMYQVQLSTQLSIAFYGTAFSVNARRDLSAQYVLFISELAKFAEDGANLMIKNGWLEEPPKASDRKSLNKKT
ncbi:hypothetical protein ASG89_33575 [Paenibacillus sp. Soil766]|uniref:DUF3231 family protein n=1 Tax=Paenibacillus sp. Soil766 TaxID=1736404 RepID=UPI00070D208D|nr:DUF3231 family protein [Paenibacillus sp. Soil766]KRE92183.1 hypothetical protein ASG89_33575 [Paenibacillus sp. Soil766]